MIYFVNSLTHFMREREKERSNQSTNDFSGGPVDGRINIRIMVSNA